MSDLLGFFFYSVELGSIGCFVRQTMTNPAIRQAALNNGLLNLNIEVTTAQSVGNAAATAMHRPNNIIEIATQSIAAIN
jgi:hypothetical protein